MKKILLIFMIILIGIGISGCNSTDKIDTFESPYIGGNTGLTATFENMGSISEATNVNSVWEDEPFLIEIILKNEGEKDLEANDITVSLKGFAQNDFTGISAMVKSNTNEIEKKSEYLPEGGEDRINFGNAQYAINFDGFYDAIIQAEIKYEYETYVAVPQVCFKYDIRDDTVCDIEETKTHYVSSAPIQVTGVRERPGGKGVIYLELDVSNQGTGRSAVPGEEVRIEYDRIAFEAIGPVSNPNLWDCTSGGVSGAARLTDGKAKIRCRADVTEDALYTQQFSIILKYDYVENIRENVRIKEALE